MEGQQLTVYVVSTAHSAVPLDSIKRWSKKEHKIVEVHCPDAVKQYNASMGGVNLVDRMVSMYRVSVCTCKGPVRVILHFFDCALKNALILYRGNARRSGTASKDILDFMAFRLRIGECWARCIQEMEKRKDLKAGAPDPATKCRKVVQHSLPEARREKAVHLPQFVQFAQRNRMSVQRLQIPHKN